LRLYVYNQEYNVTKPVELTPSRHWGGQGALGCTLGYGALHRIPAPFEEPPHAPGETLFDTNPINEKQEYSDAPQPAGEFLVPAEMQFNNPTSGTAPPKREKKTRHPPHASPLVDMDAYFNEGEVKSRELDHAPTPKAETGFPPPPKIGAPPKSPSPAT
jgi:hypothetical protein